MWYHGLIFLKICTFFCWFLAHFLSVNVGKISMNKSIQGFFLHIYTHKKGHKKQCCEMYLESGFEK